LSTELIDLPLANILNEIEKLDTDSLLLVADGKVWEKYGKYFDLKIIQKNKKIHLWKTPEGEKTKEFTEYFSCAEFFLEKGIHRQSYLVAIGGGATSDFAGFVAATLLRGIKWSIIPTTLLSMVDAAIGGKVALNAKSGKNLIGAYHSPEKVWFDYNVLNSLSSTEIRSGKGEILKYCFLDKNIYETVLSSNGDLSLIIPRCAAFKLALTNEDFKEVGKRKILNFGHTFGHAIERVYNIPHGEAVMWGMALIFKLFGENNLLGVLQKLKIVLDWPEQDPPWLHKTFPTRDIMAYLVKDKKMIDNQSIDLVFIKEVGTCEIKKIKLSKIEDLLIEQESELKKFRL